MTGTALARIPGGIYARDEAGEIVRLSEEADWATCEPGGEASGLLAGDHLLVESPAGTLRGELPETPEPGQPELTIRLAHGAPLNVPIEPIQRLYLLHVKADLEPGDLFEVKSKSGNLYSGLVQERVSSERVLVELHSGKSVDIRLDRLRLDTLQVRLPVPVAYLRGEAVTLQARPRARGTSERLLTKSGRLSRISDRIAKQSGKLAAGEEAPPRAHQAKETERLQRELLRKSVELEELKQERERLAEETKERERELESEVWRGLATNRDLTKAKKRLEKLERELDDRPTSEPEAPPA